MLLASPDNPALWATPNEFLVGEGLPAPTSVPMPMSGTREQVAAVTSAPMPQHVPQGNFPSSLIRTESGGNWNALNDVRGAGGHVGHGGRLQFGTARLADAARAGVVPPMTAQEFARQPPEVQMAVEAWHFSDIDNFIRQNGFDQMIGQSINGVPVTLDGMRAVAHLGGVGGLQRFLQSGGQYNPADANGTSLLDYLGTHSGATRGQQTMPQGLLSPNVSSMNTQEPSIWDALVGRLPESVQPIARRTIGDADWRDRMAIALAGMSTRPNQAIIGTLQDRMESRDQDRRANQTVAYLESIGRPDLAAAIAAGLPAGDAIGAALAPAPPPNLEVTDGGLVLDMNNGAVVADYRGEEGADPTAAIQNYQYLLGQGVPEEEARERAFGSNAPQVTIGDTNVTTVGENAFSQETGKILAQEAATVVEQGATAQRNMGLLASLESVLATSPNGSWAAAQLFAGELGIATQGLDDLQLAQAIINKLVPEQRKPGSGEMSDADLEMFKQSLPRIINTPGGNQRILATMRAIAEYDVARMQIARELQLQRISPEEAFAAYNRLGNPVADFVRENANPATDAPPAATNAPSGFVLSPEVQGYIDQYAPVQ